MFSARFVRFLRIVHGLGCCGPPISLQTPSLGEVGGGGMLPSVLAFASERSFIGSNMAALFNEPTR